MITMATNNNNKVLNVPNLRFPEFSGEWKKVKMGEICKFMSGGTPAMDKADYWNGDIPFISATAMHENYINGSTQRITALGLEKGSKLLKKGNLLLLVRGSMLWKRIPICYNNIDVAFNQDVKGIMAKNKDVTPYFLLYWFCSQQNRLLYRVTGTGIGAGKLDTSELLALPLYLPSKEEMNKIGNCLKLLDERIATQHKIIDKLQSLIKGLSDSLLNNPQWDKICLRSFMEFYPTNSLSWEQLSYKEGLIRNLHYGLIHSFSTIGIDSLSLPMITPNNTPKQYTLCRNGDIAFADASEDTNEIAKAVEFIDTNDYDTVCGLHTIHGRDIKNITLVGFKGFVFNSHYFHSQIRRLAQGTKVFSITVNNLMSCYAYVPNKSKQKSIVELLKTMENKLSMNRFLLEKYEIQRSYLLQQMFI